MHQVKAAVVTVSSTGHIRFEFYSQLTNKRLMLTFWSYSQNVILWSHRILQLVLCFSELAKKRRQDFPAPQAHFSRWSLHLQKCFPDPQCRASSASVQGPGVEVAGLPHSWCCFLRWPSHALVTVLIRDTLGQGTGLRMHPLLTMSCPATSRLACSLRSDQ